MPLISFYAPWKYLMFSGGIEKDQWYEMFYFTMPHTLADLLIKRRVLLQKRMSEWIVVHQREVDHKNYQGWKA